MLRTKDVDMGIMAPIARFILKEHTRKPIVGRAAFIGRQTIPLTEQQAIKLIRSEGVEVRNISVKEDIDTLSGRGKKFIDEVSFFNLFTSLDITFIDVTDYEGASVVHDMCEPLPSNLKGKFDFVWNGSCLDNIFNAASAHQHSCDLLAPNGRIITMEMQNSHYNSYCAFSQGWFFDYYAINGFSETEVYSCIFKRDRLWNGPYKVYKPGGESSSGATFLAASGKNPVITLAIATKGPNSTTDLSPIQSQYRPNNSLYETAYKKFAPRQLLKVKSTKKVGGRVTALAGFVEVHGLRGVRGGFKIKSRIIRILLHPYSAFENLLARKNRYV